MTNKFISIVLVGPIFAAWLLFAIRQFFSAKKERGMSRILTLFAATCTMIGVLGFFGTALASMGALNWLPNSFEWPIGSAKGVVYTDDGHFVVPHTPSGRIQVYDRNWRFLRGWHIDAGGGTFTVFITDTNHVHAVTARRHTHYVYNLNGDLLSSESYPVTGTGYSSFQIRGSRYIVPTPFYLWVFTNPIYSWLTAAVGLGLYMTRKKLSLSQKDSSQVC